MSIDINYFFDSDKTFEQLLREINHILGSNLIPETEGDFAEGLFFGMYASFGLHSLENDNDLYFENYKYQIGLNTNSANADLRDIQIAVVSFIAILLFSRLQIHEGILVYDVQKLLAKYKVKELSGGVRALFDEVSNKFVQVPKEFLRQAD